MKILNFKLLVRLCVILILIIFSILFYYLKINTKLRVKYEHSIELPISAINIHCKSNWWFPRNLKWFGIATISFEINKSDWINLFNQLIACKSIDSTNLNGAIQAFYCGCMRNQCEVRSIYKYKSSSDTNKVIIIINSGWDN